MKKNLVNICDRLIEYFGWNTNSSETIRQDTELRDIIFKVKDNASNYGLGITSLYNAIENKKRYSSSLADYVYAKTPRDFSTKRIYHLTTYLSIINEIVELYDEWNNSEYSQIIESLQNHDMFGRERIQIDPEIVTSVERLVKERDQIQINILQKGKAQILKSDSYIINKNVFFSQDISELTRYIDSKESFFQNTKKVTATIFCQLDPIHWIKSKWYVLLHKEDSVWISLIDRPDDMVNSIWSDSNSRFREVDLPYDLLKDNFMLRSQSNQINTKTYSSKQINYLKQAQLKFAPRDIRTVNRTHLSNEIKKLFLRDLSLNDLDNCTISIKYSNDIYANECQAIAKRRGVVVGYYESKTDVVIFYKKSELLSFDISKLDPSQKILITMLCNNLIESISENSDLEEVYLNSDYITNKIVNKDLLTRKEMCEVERWTKVEETIFNDITDSFKTTPQQDRLYGSLVDTHNYTAYTIAKEEDHQQNAIYGMIQYYSQPILSKINKLNREESTKNLLLNAIQNKHEIFLERIYSNKAITLIGKELDERREIAHIYPVVDDTTVEMKRGFGVGKYPNIDSSRKDIQTCMCCNSLDAKKVRKVNLSHYTSLLWMLDSKDKEDLPLYFRNYRAATETINFESKHPFSRIILSDPCSLENPNGIQIDIFLCGRCNNSKLKDAKEEAFIEI